MDITGLATGTIGLVGTVTACIDLWEDISNGLRVSDDLDSFIRQVDWVHLQFIIWCDQSGLWQLALDVQSDDTNENSHIQAPIDVDALILAQPIHDLVRRCLETNVRALHRYLRQTRKLLESYNACGAVRERNVLRKPNSAMAYASQIAHRSDEKMRSNGKWDAIRWGATGYRESKRLVDELQLCVGTLRGVLELINPQRASSVTRISETFATTTTSMRRAVLDVESSDKDGTLMTLTQMSQCTEEVSDLGAAETGEVQEATDTQLDFSSGEAPELDQEDFDLPLDSGPEPTTHQYTTYRGNQVLVEWRYFSSRLTRSEQDLLHHRIILLVLQLRLSSSVPGFRVLPCLGFFYARAVHRYGIVFQLPNGSEPVDLWNVLVADRRANHKMRFLDARLRLARQLVISVFRFFSVGWIHKNVRSSSVLFLDSLDDYGFPEAYLAGFGMARRETPTASTERNPSQLLDIQRQTNWRLYCHPERYQALLIDGTGDAPASTLSHMRYDAYGLGVILLEVAFGCPVAKIYRANKESIEKFQAGIAENTATMLRIYMGTGYAEIVRRLLTGDFDQEELAETDFGTGRLSFLTAFEKTVVAEMESLYLGFGGGVMQS